MAGIPFLLRLHCMGVPNDSIAANAAAWEVLGLQYHHVGEYMTFKILE